MYNKIVIDVCRDDIPEDVFYYIADCWTEFVISDLGYDIKDLPICLFDEKKQQIKVNFNGIFEMPKTAAHAINVNDIYSKINNLLSQYGFKGSRNVINVGTNNINIDDYL